jgi:hypothetical protein
MKKRLIMLVALLAVVAIAVPAFALEFKYGGMYRLRWQSSDNVVDGGGYGEYLDNSKEFRYQNQSYKSYLGWPSPVTAKLKAHDTNDNQNYMDQRLRMYFSFVASENLQVVTKFEIDNIWGYSPDKFTGGGAVGADGIIFEVKNVYVDFNVPYTPVRATLGVQGVQLLSGWMLDDDFSAAKFSAKFDPITVTAGYIAGYNSDVTNMYSNVDDWFISLDYAQGPFKAGLLGLLQNAHSTDASTFMNPRTTSAIRANGGAAANGLNSIQVTPTLNTYTPSGAIVSGGSLYPAMATSNGNANVSGFGTTLAINQSQAGWVTESPNTVSGTTRVQTVTTGGTTASPIYYERNTAWNNYNWNLPVAKDNYLFDLGAYFEYKLSWMKAYVNFVKNFGSFKFLPGTLDQDIDYAGYMVDVGVNFYTGPFTFTVNGFLASGDNLTNSNEPVSSDGNFRYPVGGSHYWSEILGMGVLDSATSQSNLQAFRAASNLSSSATGAIDNLSDANKRSPGDYGYSAGDGPSNLWMINVGAAYQALEKTKLTLNYYYIGTQASVLSGTYYNRRDNSWYAEYSSSIGHELDFYVDQGIVDGLNLRLVFAYLWANQGYTIYNNDGDSWETGFVLQWNF